MSTRPFVASPPTAPGCGGVNPVLAYGLNVNDQLVLFRVERHHLGELGFGGDRPEQRGG